MIEIKKISELKNIIKEMIKQKKQLEIVKNKMKRSSNSSQLKILTKRKNQILNSLSDLLVKYKKFQEEDRNFIPTENSLNSQKPDIDLQTTSIELLNLSTRSYYCLKNEGINSIGDLVQYNDMDLFRIPNFGQKSYDEVKGKIDDLNLKFSPEGEIISFNEKIIPRDEKQNTEKQYNPNLYIKINDLDLSYRSQNVLGMEKITYLGELIQYTEGELLRLPNFGRTSLNELKEVLTKYNLSFASYSNPPPEFRKDEKLIYSDLEGQNLSESIIQLFGPAAMRTAIRELPIANEEEMKIVKLMDIDKSNPLTIDKLLEITKEELSKVFLDIESDYQVFQKLKIKIPSYLLKKTNNKIFITPNFKFEDIEKQITDDIQSWFLSLSETQLDVVKQRLGYQTGILTLAQLGKKYKVTRERIRQIEAKAIKKISKFVSFDLDSLNSYLKKYENRGFNSLFPKLFSSFLSGKIAQKKRDIGDTNFNYFLEKYCNVKADYFTTPDKVALEIINHSIQVKNLFKNMVLPFSRDEFSYQISTELGIPKDFIIGTFDYLVEQNIITKLSEDKFYPFDITKKNEILAILNSYPNGLHALDIFNKINSSPSKVKIKRLHPFSINGALEKDNTTMFCGKGSVKLIKFSNIDLIDKKNIFPLVISHLKKNSMVTSLDNLFENLKKFLPEEVDIFDLRYVIKNSGQEYGVFFTGKSQARTVSLDKPVRLNRSQEIYNYINKLDTYVTIETISKTLKISEGVINGQIGDLIKSGMICRYSANNYTSNQYAYRNFNDDEVSADILKILQSNKFVTNDFIAEKLNDKYYESKSNYFYSSYLFYLNIKKKMNMNYHQDIFSFDVIPTKSFTYIVRGYINENEDMEENYRSLSNSMSISHARFKRFFYHHFIYGAI